MTTTTHPHEKGIGSTIPLVCLFFFFFLLTHFFRYYWWQQQQWQQQKAQVVPYDDENRPKRCCRYFIGCRYIFFLLFHFLTANSIFGVLFQTTDNKMMHQGWHIKDNAPKMAGLHSLLHFMCGGFFGGGTFNYLIVLSLPHILHGGGGFLCF